MGQNKALLPLGGVTCIERVLAVARHISTQVTVVANDPKSYEFLNCPMISDIHRGIGPLGGIHAALDHSPTRWVLILSCDVPFITTDLLRYLIAQTDSYDIIVPRSEDARLQPLCALYARSCLDEISRLIEAGDLAPRALFPRLKTRIVEWAEIHSLPGADLFFLDIDTPEHYEYARKLVDTI
jgi:molybdopterin-guanine dinucleotide biosynthesis protein A